MATTAPGPTIRTCTPTDNYDELPEDKQKWMDRLYDAININQAKAFQTADLAPSASPTDQATATAIMASLAAPTNTFGFTGPYLKRGTFHTNAMDAMADARAIKRAAVDDQISAYENATSAVTKSQAALAARQATLRATMDSAATSDRTKNTVIGGVIGAGVGGIGGTVVMAVGWGLATVPVVGWLAFAAIALASIAIGLLIGRFASHMPNLIDYQNAYDKDAQVQQLQADIRAEGTTVGNDRTGELRAIADLLTGLTPPATCGVPTQPVNNAAPPAVATPTR